MVRITIALIETVPNRWNGTMFGDLDLDFGSRPLNASRGFVSIS